jgi:hypothetical protein
VIWEGNYLFGNYDEALIANLSAQATSFPFNDDVFRAYSLSPSDFYTYVGQNETLTFHVTLRVLSLLDGGGTVTSNFSSHVGFLMCPYVALQVALVKRGPF